MLKKIHWGHGLMLVLALFILTISTFVYKTITQSKYDHHLVSDQYYEDEMNYPKEQQRLKNADNLTQKVQIQKSEEGILIVFPSIFNPKDITGTYQIQRTNNAKLDIINSIKLTSSNLLIEDQLLEKGRYNIKLIWQYDGVPFQINKKMTY